MPALATLSCQFTLTRGLFSLRLDFYDEQLKLLIELLEAKILLREVPILVILFILRYFSIQLVEALALYIF